MKNKIVTFDSNIDSLSFLSFSFFDTYILKNKLRKTLIYSGIFLVIAILAYMMRGTMSNTRVWGIGSVILAVALPLMNLVNWLKSALNAVSTFNLSKDRTVYHLVLSENGIGVVRGSESFKYKWDDVYAVYRRRKCVYLYVAYNKAYLMPKNSTSDDAWELIVENVPAGKIHVTGKN